MLPVARTDLLSLLNSQNKLASRTKDIVVVMLGRQMELPASLQGPVRTYYQQSLRTAKQALKAINELDELLETGFRGKQVEFVEKLITELDELEQLNDVTQIGIRASLLKLEPELPPVNVMFMYKIIDLIGDIADISQTIGSRLALLMAK